jgi:hypothetical protein
LAHPPYNPELSLHYFFGKALMGHRYCFNKAAIPEVTNEGNPSTGVSMGVPASATKGPFCSIIL